MGLTMNGLLFFMIVLFVVLALIAPRKTSISMFNQSIDRYNAFVSEYNDVIMELQLIQQEIFNKRYKEEDITEIKKIQANSILYRKYFRFNWKYEKRSGIKKNWNF